MWRRHSWLHMTKHPLNGDFNPPLIESHTLDINFQIALALALGQLTYGCWLYFFGTVQNKHFIETILCPPKPVPSGNPPDMTLQYKQPSSKRKMRLPPPPICLLHFDTTYWILWFPILYWHVLPSMYTYQLVYNIHNLLLHWQSFYELQSSGPVYLRHNFIQMEKWIYCKVVMSCIWDHIAW